MKGTPEDEDVQPPHRQAGNYYPHVAYMKDGQFKVTMEYPAESRPKPMQVEITDRGARLLTVSVLCLSRDEELDRRMASPKSSP